MDRPGLKLLYFSRGYTPHDRRYLQSLVDSEYSVRFLRLTGERREKRDLPQGVHAIQWIGGARPLKTPLDYAIRYVALRRILVEERPEAVLAGPVQTSAFLVALTGYAPLVTMSWGSDMLVDASRSACMRAVTRYTLRRSAGALGDCQAVRDRIGTFAPLAADRIVTFPWGVDLGGFVQRASALSLREDLAWKENPIFISTRAWEPLYAVDVLVRAFARVHDRRPDVRLILLGDGSQAPMIRRLVCQLDLTDCIYAPGQVCQEVIAEYFYLADVYVSSALSDGTSVSLLEAMACGLPAVVTDNCGNREWVKPGQNGWLVAPGDHAGLAGALDEALADPLRREEMKRTNIALVRARANWNNNFPRLLQLLECVAVRPSSLNRSVGAGPIASGTR